MKLKSIAAADAGGLIGEASPVQRAEEPIAGAIAGKDAARSIAAVRGRREADDEQPRIGVAEARDRPAPVLPVAIRSAFFERDLFAPRDKPRALETVHDLVGNLG